MNPKSDSVVLGYETSVSSNAEVIVCMQNEPNNCSVFTDNEPKTLHNITLNNLVPDTWYTYEARYMYRGTTTSYPVQKFRTLPSTKRDFSFYLYGDSRANEKVHSQIANRIVSDNQRSQSLFVVHTGDMVTHGYDWKLWEMHFFRPTENLYRTLPIVPVLGNHEQNQKLYYDYFDLPNNESWYSFKQGNAEFFALNTNIAFSPKSQQYKWFESALQKSTSKWKIVIFHHPPFSCSPSRKPGAMNVRNHLVPVMEKYKVNLVLLGHDHLYGRTNPINGIVYVTSGGGGAGLYSAEPDEFSPVCIRKHHFVRFDVKKEKLSWKAIDLNGNVIDEFQLE